MSDTCPICGGETDDFEAIAEHAHQEVFELGKRIFESRQQWKAGPDVFLDAIMAGMLTGIVNVGFVLTHPEGRDALMDYLRDYLDVARGNVEDGDEGGSTLQ